MSPAEREARILQFWEAVELFSPQKIPRLNPNHWKYPVFRAIGETPLPWHSSHWFRAAEAGRKWRFTAYCGIYKQGRVSAFLERKFGRDAASFDRRPDSESCLFALQITEDGRPLLDTFVLASCSWAVGRLRNCASGVDWMKGFEGYAQEEGLRLAERFAVREDDEVGRELNRKPGTHVGRPIQPNDLEIEIERVADSLGIAAVLLPQDLRLAARQIDEKYQFEPDTDDFLNSFFLRDLERLADEAAQANNSAALSCFLSPEQAVPTETRCDVRTSVESLWQNTAPKLVPVGRWPAPSSESLYFSQQFAVNAALDTFAKQATPLFGINGPPGTGKTTLLRDLIASVFVERARALAKMPRPTDAFAGPPAHWTTDGFERSISLWREELLGFEIVVASSNNRAVENVTLEIPARRAVGEEYLADIDYFGDFASRLLSERKTKDREQHGSEAWGLIAARLGSKKNRRSFISKFWFANKESAEPRTRAEDGFQKYLQTVKARAHAWKTAVASFEAALEREERIREQRTAAWNAIETQGALNGELKIVRAKLETAKESARDARESMVKAQGCYACSEIRVRDALSARREHLQFKPGLVDAVFTAGAAYREWRDKDRRLLAAVQDREREWKLAGTERDAKEQTVQVTQKVIAGLLTEKTRQENQLCEHNNLLSALREKLGGAFPVSDRWLSSPNARELSSPWADEHWNRARTEVFIAALHLHRTFVECVPDKIRKNLHAAMDILGGKLPPGIHGEALRSAWATLFFVIPVVSTTFASFDRLFSHVHRAGLGWLLIDEAGQATPQSTAGALWRSKRAVLVGDPRQLEPIVTLPFTAQQALRAHFGLEETWLPSRNSAQTLADRVTRLGTWLPSENQEEPNWVGSPLRVHRRCEKPMFEMSNQIAYGGQMVYHTQEAFSSLPPSSWIDIAGAESDDHWIPAEGLALESLLADLLRAGANPANILLLSPFRVVARKLREIAAKYFIVQAGTIHVSQGKEADIVILVLGGDPRRLGAKDWASEKPNLLNVAVSRAKRRLFIIGNREEWSEYSYFSDVSALFTKEENLRVRSMSGSR